MIAARRITKRAVDFRADQVAHGQAAFDLLESMRARQPGPEPNHAAHARSTGAGVEPALIRHLSTRFDIERRVREHGIAALAVIQRLDGLLLGIEERQHRDALHARVGVPVKAVAGLAQ